VLADRGGDPLAECREEVGPRLEAVLVEVIARPLAGAQDEIALEIRGGEERLAQLHVAHARRAAMRTCRATGSSRAPSGEPGPKVTNEPSSK